jgi:dTDP-4-dehydrorhamnose reductase
MKILLLGKNGHVGWELNRTLLSLGEIIALDIDDLDLTRTHEIRQTVRTIKPNIIVNAAAYTAVDKAEVEQELAMAINGVAPGILAEEAKRCGALFIHYSTDYVFDGTKDAPYKENDKPNPVNFYGISKLAGEKAIQAVDNPFFIFRTSWVYGLRGNNFLLTMKRLAMEKEVIKVVNDQIGSPTWSRLIAEVTAQIIATKTSSVLNDLKHLQNLSGIYHLTSSGYCNRYTFAMEIIKFFTKITKKSVEVKSISSFEYQTKAKRPKN